MADEIPIPDEYAGQRFDRVLARLFPDYSRSQLKGWIEAGHARLDGQAVRPREPVHGGQLASLDAPDRLDEHSSVSAQAIPLHIVYEDEDLVVLDKPPGLVVHPGAGNPDGTLENALLHRFPELAAVPRHGLIHRLDKDTSGLLVIARSSRAHARLTEAMQAREIVRRYQALVIGSMPSGGTVDAPLARHPVDRKRIAVRQGGREAVTHYRVAERFPFHTLLDVKLETGRTHQIRVHMAHVRYPIVGDPVYGRRLSVPRGATETLAESLRGFRRQALHAARLSLTHPVSGETIEVAAELPTDFQALLRALREDARAREAEARRRADR
ncbi:23S rRNA pseudouridine(1911/1915/1917) synthase RluD [Natronospira sp. AB-CW4]|uniref:Pseudouridine synthase n=1 Tax=Natronospira bacteriovora TaxID=3069753 RepID=A0ABU0W9I7_9GAMM|nr:23S rRNA pseudouridine(1911/1915/1917) synthase RluD [Natronospira sp. AB-CW4]MDQ2070423.1 23S rRNA pseudouridine(1911/1915/1917) synthase RluD [Natronospira sp. AB-CW4]